MGFVCGFWALGGLETFRALVRWGVKGLGVEGFRDLGVYGFGGLGISQFGVLGGWGFRDLGVQVSSLGRYIGV